MTSESNPTMFLRKDIVILMAEDDHGHYILAKRFLREAGLDNEIIRFEDGEATLSYLNNGGCPSVSGKKYVLLLDIRMPKVDGVKVLRDVKGSEKLQDIPVIMLTTSEDQHIANLCYELGCEAHVIKPPGDVLLRAIERIGLRI